MTLREGAEEEAAIEGWTALQLVEMVDTQITAMEKRPGWGKTTASRVVAEFKDRVKLASRRADAWSNGTIEGAITIKKRLLSDIECKRLLIEIDDVYHQGGNGEYVNSISKIVSVLGRCKTLANTRACLKGVLQGLKSKTLSPGELSADNLKKFAVETVILRWSILSHFSKHMLKVGLPEADVALLNQRVGTFEAMQAAFSDELSWMKRFHHDASRDVTKFVRRLCYTSEFNSAIKTAARARKDVSQLLEYENIKPEVDAMWAKRKAKPQVCEIGSAFHQGGEPGGDQRVDVDDLEEGNNENDNENETVKGDDEICDSEYVPGSQQFPWKQAPDANKASEVCKIWKMISKMNAEYQQDVARIVNEHSQ